MVVVVGTITNREVWWVSGGEGFGIRERVVGGDKTGIVCNNITIYICRPFFPIYITDVMGPNLASPSQNQIVS